MNLPRLLRTVRYLKPGQAAYRLWWPLRPRSLGTAPDAILAAVPGPWQKPAPKPRFMAGPLEFVILNQPIRIQDAGGWNDSSRDKLLLYHLHYMDDLGAADAPERTEWHRALIDRWIRDNAPGQGNGWEPYPLSLRIVNWIKWQREGNELSANQLASLTLQAQALCRNIEHHLQANHLIANAKGLFFGGTFFSGPSARRWRLKGTRLLESQVREQVLEDGGHFERSPMYQAVLIEDFLDVVNLSVAYGVPVPNGIEAVIEPMLAWLDGMTHRDGEPAYFNDTVAAHAPRLVELSEYAARLGFGSRRSVEDGLLEFRSSGYFRYRERDTDVFVDAGEIGPDFQPGHAHCDCLSFELAVGGRRVLVNTGISTYNDCARRHLERGTAAHNTVGIDDLEQSEIWGAFRVGRRARPLGRTTGVREISAAHDGYRRKGIIHRRRFRFQDQLLEIRDELDSNRASTGKAYFHYHPDCMPSIEDGVISAGPVRMTFDGAQSIDIEPYEYCLGFNKRQAAKKVVVTFCASLESRIHYEDSLRHR